MPTQSHTIDFILIFMKERKGNVLFNDTLNTFYLRLYGIRHMVKDHSDSEKGILLPPHRLLFLIKSKGSFNCTIPPTGLCYTSRGTLAGTRNSSMGSPHEGSIRRPIAPWAKCSYHGATSRSSGVYFWFSGS